MRRPQSQNATRKILPRRKTRLLLKVSRALLKRICGTAVRRSTDDLPVPPSSTLTSYTARRNARAVKRTVPNITPHSNTAQRTGHSVKRPVSAPCTAPAMTAVPPAFAKRRRPYFARAQRAAINPDVVDNAVEAVTQVALVVADRKSARSIIECLRTCNGSICCSISIKCSRCAGGFEADEVPFPVVSGRPALPDDRSDTFLYGLRR